MGAGRFIGTELNIERKMKLRATSKGNYMGYYKGHYVSIFKRPHGYWSCAYGKGGEWINMEGYFTSWIRTLDKATKWAKSEIDKLT